MQHQLPSNISLTFLNVFLEGEGKCPLYRQTTRIYKPELCVPIGLFKYDNACSSEVSS